VKGGDADSKLEIVAEDRRQGGRQDVDNNVNFGNFCYDASVNAASAHHNTHYDRPLLAMVSGYFIERIEALQKNPQTK
jgi:hypothetical protein